MNEKRFFLPPLPVSFLSREFSFFEDEERRDRELVLVILADFELLRTGPELLVDLALELLRTGPEFLRGKDLRLAPVLSRVFCLPMPKVMGLPRKGKDDGVYWKREKGVGKGKGSSARREE